jgi:carbonic anhydrase
MSEHALTKWNDLVARHADVAAAHPTDMPDLPPHRPEVAILACSDARVPPSLIFSQEPGSSFVVRVAGNSATPDVVASLTYAVEVLGVDLVVVLGHTGCGAVTAALSPTADPNLNPILTPIDEMLAGCPTCNDVDAAVGANVRHNVGRLHRDRGALGAAIASGRVMVRGAVHDLRTGRLIELDPVGASGS